MGRRHVIDRELRLGQGPELFGLLGLAPITGDQGIEASLIRSQVEVPVRRSSTGERTIKVPEGQHLYRSIDRGRTEPWRRREALVQQQSQ